MTKTLRYDTIGPVEEFRWHPAYVRRTVKP
jgi:hypothetical protein